MKKIIILNGVARCGKDTFADSIIERGREKNFNCYILSTVDRVKEICEMMGACKNVKTNKNRKLWSDFKDMWTNYNNGPFNDIIEKISYLYDGKISKSIYIIMCREPEEIAKFKNHFGFQCLTILIRRKNIEIPNNHADQNVENFQYDKYIENNGTIEDLYKVGYDLCDNIFN